MKWFFFLVVNMSFSAIVLGASNGLSQVKHGQVVAIDKDEKYLQVKLPDGNKDQVKIENVLDIPKNKKIQAGSHIQFISEISQNR
jgi:uncharacterized protein YsxB (DUF464 family)